VRHVIVPAGPQDALELAQVHVAAWRETYRGLLPDSYLNAMSVEIHARRWRWSLSRPREGEVVLAAAERDRLVGYAAAGRGRGDPSEAEVATLYLLRAAQGRGLGRALLASTARVLAAQGAHALLISVLRDNLSARGFYEHLGGIAEAPRVEPGPGGVLHEVAYRWPDITTLTRA